MKEKTARILSELLLRHGGEQNNILDQVRTEESHEEFLRIRSMIGETMGSIYFNALSAIFAEFPGLEPKYLRQDKQ